MAGNYILLHIRSTTTSNLFFNLLQLFPLFRMPHFDENREVYPLDSAKKCALLCAIKIVQEPDVPSNEYASKEAYDMVKSEAITHLEWLLAEDHRAFSEATFLSYNVYAEPLRKKIKDELKWGRLLAAITCYWTNQAGGRSSRPPDSGADQ